jgi:hypothetical protein
MRISHTDTHTKVKAWPGKDKEEGEEEEGEILGWDLPGKAKEGAGGGRRRETLNGDEA